MTGRVALSLVLHNHQPVGNFGWVIADVFEKAYEPLVGALERHPRLRLALHYSGPLLDWLASDRPDFLDRLRALVERDQVEILGGGLAEPILAAIPERDRLGQLRRMADVVEATFGTRPGGAWLAERVWEPDLPTSIVDAGYRWTVLDDAHFRAAAVPDDALWAPYVTEDQGRPLVVFGTEQGLRYRIPFRPVAEVIDYLRAHASEDGEALGTMGDDGEKLGAWPSTWDHAWGRGRWVEDFLGALEANDDWLSTVRPSDWLADHPPVSRVYLPTGSYAEMGEWALPPDESRAFSTALRAARDAGRPEARWLRGGFWRAFQVRYREINDLHKQMLRASAGVAGLPAGAAHDAAREAATDHLYRGQSNDCYWHGLFGGIYIPHMRAATLAELIAAEDVVDQATGRTEAAELADLDLDLRDEARLATIGEVVTVELDEGAGIGSWDLRAARHAVTGVLRRRPEAYHAALLEGAERAQGSGAEDPDRPASIHDRIRARESGLAGRIRYDAYERRSGLLRIVPADRTPEAWGAGGDADLGDPAAPTLVADLADRRLVTRSRVVVDGQPLEITREVRLGGGRLDPSLSVGIEVVNAGTTAIRARFGQEWATTMLGGGANPAAWWEIGGRRRPHDGSGRAGPLRTLAQGNDWLGIAIVTTTDRAVDAWWAPIETISNSEGGVERSYQGSGWLLSEVTTLAAGGRWSLEVEHRAAIAATSGRSPSGGRRAARRSRSGCPSRTATRRGRKRG